MLFTNEMLKFFPNIDEELLARTLFEMNRYYDCNLKKYYNDIKKNENRVFDSFEKNMLRKYYYYKKDDILKELNVTSFPSIFITKKDVKEIEKLTLDKLKLYDQKKIINSIKTRVSDIYKIDSEKRKALNWLDKYEKHNNYDFIVIRITDDMVNNVNDIDRIFELVSYSYDNLTNYRYIALVMEHKIFKNEIDISWNILYKTAIYMEGFRKFKGNFLTFKKDKKIQEMIDFLNSDNNLKHGKHFDRIARQFYEYISTGFSFNDLLISDNQEKKILLMKKIELDETHVRCPACNSTISRGNSYPLMFLKSWECQNPDCSERSKSGRGKRFDEYGVYRYFKLVENNENNNISRKMYDEWRRDIFSNELDIYEMLLMYYSWNKEKCLFINVNYDKNYKTRNIYCLSNSDIPKIYNLKFNELPIYNLFKSILKYSYDNDSKVKLKYSIELFNDDSVKGLNNISVNQVHSAITSPPYYNAREYSQWPNLLLYLVDMMLNAKCVYNVLNGDGTYLYNIGDIVCADNIYVNSNMSKRRIMLGFYSALVFEIVGFNLMGNKIWDKGEVESKRNSTTNFFSGYIKYVNCYEHVLVFRKSNKQFNYDNEVYKIKPVYKINSKGENVLGHTAPYPEELVNLIGDYIPKKEYLLDPFLGSGTSGIWAVHNERNFIGFELNNDYYKLSMKRINDAKKETIY